MSRRAARFTEADVYRALKAAQSAGVDYFVEITAGWTIGISTSPF